VVLSIPSLIGFGSISARKKIIHEKMLDLIKSPEIDVRSYISVLYDVLRIENPILHVQKISS